jgi:predicted HTH domain antitoxin
MSQTEEIEMQTLTVTVSEELATQLGPYQDHLDDPLLAGLREVKLSQSLALFKQGHISVWKAARFANVSLREMIQYLIANNVRPVFEDEYI